MRIFERNVNSASSYNLYFDESAHIYDQVDKSMQYPKLNQDVA